MSSLKECLSPNRKTMLEMPLVFHVDMCPYLAIAALGLATHALTAVYILSTAGSKRVADGDDIGIEDGAIFELGSKLGTEDDTVLGVALGNVIGIEDGARLSTADGDDVDDKPSRVQGQSEQDLAYTSPALPEATSEALSGHTRL
mmetsp:Transcript_15218/g.57864  ORF Transcript_15218/g.57864 Transcript_15218/m.57864 type:complete len:145 (+) Transcript_15218:92-526(+)